MLSILIVDQNPLACIGIQALLNSALRNQVQIQLASSKKELEDLIADSEIDLFILGFDENSEIDPPYLTKDIFEIRPGVPVIIFYDAFSLESMISLFHQGATGFISKPRVGDELSSCLISVLKGEMYMCDYTSQNIIKAWTEKRKISGSR